MYSSRACLGRLRLLRALLMSMRTYVRTYSLTVITYVHTFFERCSCPSILSLRALLMTLHHDVRTYRHSLENIACHYAIIALPCIFYQGGRRLFSPAVSPGSHSSDMYVYIYFLIYILYIYIRIDMNKYCVNITIIHNMYTLYKHNIVLYSNSHNIVYIV